MILTLQISFENLSEANNALRVSRKDFDRVVKNGRMEDGDYAHAILWARKLLSLSNNTNDCCYDHQEQPVQSIADDLVGKENKA